MALDLATRRRFFAEEIEAVGSLRTPALVEALATVPREKFLGPGPWQIANIAPGGDPYRPTADADPARVYHDIVIAIDPARRLNNGHPSSVTRWIDAIAPQPGERVLHVGTGTGYYTAILAHTVGSGGAVLGLEADVGLAARARDNLADLAWVEVAHGDGSEPAHPVLGERDVIFFSAGATHPREAWLDALAPGGRLMIPLTVDLPGYDGIGMMLRVERVAGSYAARFTGPVQIFGCVGARDPALIDKLKPVVTGPTARRVQTLRRDPHDPADTCVLHLPGCCLSA